MHKSSLLKFFPERGLFFTTVCLAGVLAFYVLDILPHRQSLTDLDDALTEIKTRIDEQRLIGPLYQKFTQMLDQSRPNTANPLLVKRQGLTTDQVTGIEPLIRSLATAQGVRVRKLEMDLNSMINTTDELLLSLAVEGAMPQLHAFALKLNELPGLAHMERIQIRPNSADALLLMEMDLWLTRIH